MKKIILLIAVGFISFSFTASAEDGNKQMKKDLKVMLNPKSISLSENNGMVDVKFQIAVPRCFVHKKHQYIFTPVLTDYTNALPLPSVIIDGKKYAKMAAKQGHSKRMKEKMLSAPDMSNAILLKAAKNPRMITYETVVPFQAWMQNADLVTVQRFNSRKETTVIAEDVYAKGVAYTPAPVPVATITEVEKIVTEGMFNVHFNINSSVIDPKLENNMSELKNLSAIVAQIRSNTDNVLDSIVIIASSSPDGVYERNKKLAAARAESAKRYLITDLDMKAMNVDMIKPRCIAENWVGLDQLVNASDVSNKEGIIKAVSIPDLVKRERAMMALPQYGYMKKNILPQLRFVKYQIYYHTTVVNVIVVETPQPQQVQQPAAQPQQLMMQPNANVPQRAVIKDKHHGKRNVLEMKDKVSPHYMRYHR